MQRLSVSERTCKSPEKPLISVLLHVGYPAHNVCIVHVEPPNACVGTNGRKLPTRARERTGDACDDAIEWNARGE